MTEKEKMQRQMLYDANHDESLLEERAAAKGLCYEFNQLHPSDECGQQELIKKLLGKTTGTFLYCRPVLVRLRLQYRNRRELLCQSQHGHSRLRQSDLWR